MSDQDLVKILLTSMASYLSCGFKEYTDTVTDKYKMSDINTKCQTFCMYL